MKTRIASAFAIALVAGVTAAAQQPPAPAGQAATAAQAPPAPPRTPRTIAPVDITGYWVALITEDWRWRMLTPPKGDYASVPINDEGRRVADSWNLAKDEAGGLACKPYGVGNIMRMPGRMHITWQDDTTLKLEFDAGTQTRLLNFADKAVAKAPKTWQGYSAANWEIAGQSVAVDRNGIPVAPPAGGRGGRGGGGGGGGGRGAAPPRGGSLHVVTTNFREGYLRKNGVPYSENASITEYFDKVGPEPNGDIVLLVRTVVEDPKYLQVPFITSTHFKLEKDGAKWNPSPCKIDPPVEVPAKP
jgi:hypothetical protein